MEEGKQPIRCLLDLCAYECVVTYGKKISYHNTYIITFSKYIVCTTKYLHSSRFKKKKITISNCLQKRIRKLKYFNKEKITQLAQKQGQHFIFEEL